MHNSVSEVDKERIRGFLKFATQQATTLEMQPVHDRVDLFSRLLNAQLSIQDFQREVRVLRETFEAGLQFKYFYLYPLKMAERVNGVEHRWSATLATFPDFREDITAAVDCYALKHNSASVFYLMKIMEKAVQKFGKKLGVNLARAVKGKKLQELSWGQILDALNPQLSKLSQKTLTQKRKFERYSAIQAHQFNVKEAWRNPSMHPRATGYNSLETEDILNHVQAFLNGLSGLFAH